MSRSISAKANLPQPPPLNVLLSIRHIPYYTPKVSMDNRGPVMGRSSLRQPGHQVIHGRNVVSLTGLILFGPAACLSMNVVT